MEKVIQLHQEMAELVCHTIESSGQPLDRATRHLMEANLAFPGQRVATAAPFANRSEVPRFAIGGQGALESEARESGSAARSFRATKKRLHHLESVRVHTGTLAARSAAALGAAAYCVGNHVVFGEGHYQPETAASQRLLAHELAHYLQQQNARPWLIQRTEADESAVPAGVMLQDSESDINRHVNNVLRRARSGSPTATLVVERAYDELGVVDFFRPWLAKIEVWAESLPVATASSPGKIYSTPQATSKYRDVTYRGWSVGGDSTLAPVMLLHGIRMGSDKIGHFFQLGYDYYIRSSGSFDTAAFGRASELGAFGVANTGVYSPADLEANVQGMRFYNALKSRPSLTFSIRDWVSDRWDERQNPSRYATAVGHVVWKNLIHGNWNGQFTHPGAVSPVPIAAAFSVTGVSSVGGSFSYGSATRAVSGAISGGRISYTTDTSSLITGVRINYDWTSGANSGKGVFVSRGETQLEGTWGYGTSLSGGGNWQLYKVA